MKISFEKLKNLNIDKIVVMLALFYVLAPIVIFLFGWIRLPYAIIGSIFIIGLGISILKSLTGESEVKQAMFEGVNIRFVVGCIIVAAIWVYLSGIGSMVYQNGDYLARNPIFRDLSTYSWPVIYDLSKESEIVQSLCGNGKVALSYYFCWWLPVSLISKICGLGEMARNIMLYLWALLGVLLVIYLLCRKMNKCSWVIPVALIFFSGMDIIPYIARLLVSGKQIDLSIFIKHMEWWAGIDRFQYSANTTQLFWVFNQAIPVWVIISLLIQMTDSKYVAGVLSLTFAYSAWATFGMVPYALYATLNGKKEFKLALNLFNIGVPILMLAVFGSFYMTSIGSQGHNGLIFSLYPDETLVIMVLYIIFIFVEFGAYYLIMGRSIVKYEYFAITLTELIVIPLFVVRDFNFELRASLPALFMTMVYVIKYLLEYRTDKKLKYRRYALIIALCCGMMTPLTEINRTIYRTLSSDDILMEQIGSFGDIQTSEEQYINTVKDLYFAYDYEDTVFFKYLAKH